MEAMPEEVEATMFLCDAAQQMGGKLYILGGGWSMVFSQGQPLMMSLAVKLAVPWNQANEQLTIHAALLTEDGEPVETEQGLVHAEGQLEVGRPPGMKRGQSIDAPFVLPFNGLPLEAGGYVWRLEVNGKVCARSPFRVLAQPPPMGGPIG